MDRGDKQTGDRKDRIPPNQRATERFPVLTYGPVPRIDLSQWRFTMSGLVEEAVSFTWDEFRALPQVRMESDIHCVTGWSRLDNGWEGVAAAELMKRIHLRPEAKHVMVHCYGDYTTNLSLTDLQSEGVLFAHKHNGEPLTPEHGWPLRLVVPHLYFWKSAKWVRGLTFTEHDQPGFWESAGYHMRGDPWKEERYSR
jgi:DMSO/TMAO reductase YedYZ molybdopterin-dependent catalytic subunit